MAPEGEQYESDQRFGAFEAERNPGEQTDLGVGLLDQGVGQARVEVVVDGLAVLHDLLCELDQGLQA